MTGQLISGTPMKDAVMYQQIIMFMISASTALGVLYAVVVSLNFKIIDVKYLLFFICSLVLLF